VKTQDRELGLALNSAAGGLTFVYVAFWVGVPAESAEWLGLYIWPLTPYGILIGLLYLHNPPNFFSYNLSFLSTIICICIAIIGNLWYLYGAVSQPLYDTFIVRMGIVIIPLGQWSTIILVPVIAFLRRQ